MLSSVLIANRGEIACRIIRTARRLGLRTIAVYSEADAAALHVREADEAHLIGPAPARQSYLDINRIIDTAVAARAACIHPGYGFLSENPEFAEACHLAGIVFVGPPAEAIRAMGHKDAAKKLMSEAGVPIVPGYQGKDQREATLAKAAARTGYPVMIKAVAGGGGKGMRRVEAPAGFADALAGCRREAQAAFGDDRVLIEKFIANPRHVEVQVLADAHGNCVHLFERDCSLQRRHQKVIEEAPAPKLSPAIREEMCEAAVAAARAVGYVGAGTVEFIAGTSDDGQVDSFYFMEMNTRLQVEHPVTEMILGLDLVELQLRIAAKEPLPFAQGDLAANGHAVEARLYAENPATGFLPQSGTFHAFWTADREGLRIDTGVRDGSEITPYYDPMIAKLVAWGESRGSAIRTLHRALAETVVVGLATNLGFLGRILARHEFQHGGVTTDFIDAHIAELKGEALPQGLLGGAIAAWLDDADRAPGGVPAGWSLQGLPRKDFHALVMNGEPVAIEVSYKADSKKDVTAARSDGKFKPVTLERYAASFKDNVSGTLFAAVGSEHAAMRAEDVLGRADVAGGGPAVVHAPMPGRVIAILVKQDEAVAPGQPLLVLDAMKMEHTLKAGLNATVKRLPVSIGTQVKEGDVLCVLEEATPSEGT